MASDQVLYGRNRESIADISDRLYAIFTSHPECTMNSSQEPTIPANALVDIISEFSRTVGGTELMTAQEMAEMSSLIEATPGVECTPEILIAFIAQRTSSNPLTAGESEDDMSTDESSEHSSGSRGRAQRQTRSASRDTQLAAENSAGESTRPTHTPSSSLSSKFDARQRSAPLQGTPKSVAAPPSSWSVKRPTPAHRRKSSTGSVDDRPQWGHRSRNSSRETGYVSESDWSATPQTSRRHRGASNPVSPISPDFGVGSISRPGSRSGYHGPASAGSVFSPPPLPLKDFEGNKFSPAYPGVRTSPGANLFPIRPPADGNDSEEEVESEINAMHDRTLSMSSARSLEYEERLEACQRSNEELSRKLIETEQLLKRRIEEGESDMEMLEAKYEEACTELSARKHNEKELRSKERLSNTQLSALEQEVLQLTKQVEQGRQSYAALQRQFQDQFAEMENLRIDVRQRDEAIRQLRDSAVEREHALEQANLRGDSLEARIKGLELKVAAAEVTERESAAQKRELEERATQILSLVRERDQLLAASEASRHASAAGSLRMPSGPLENEIRDKDKPPAAAPANTDADDNYERTTVTTFTTTRGARRRPLPEKLLNLAESAEEPTPSVSESTVTAPESDIYVFGASMSDRENSLLHDLSFDVNDIQDESSLVDPSERRPALDKSAVSMQDDEAQTDDVPPPEPEVVEKIVERVVEKIVKVERPQPEKATSEMQTDIDATNVVIRPFGCEVVFHKADEEVIIKRPEHQVVIALADEQVVVARGDQRVTVTERDQKVVVAGKDEQVVVAKLDQQVIVAEKDQQVVVAKLDQQVIVAERDDHVTVKSRDEVAPEEPPAYSPSRSEEEIAGEAIAKLHPSVDSVLESVHGGINVDELLEAWKAIKEQTGVDCLVLDKLITERASQAAASAGPSSSTRRRSFYNIYNTYFYNAPQPAPRIPSLPSYAWAGIFVAVWLAFTSRNNSASYDVFTSSGMHSGMPNPFDRDTWAAYNSIHPAGEGVLLPGEVQGWAWDFVSKTVTGAVRLSRGFPG